MKAKRYIVIEYEVDVDSEGCMTDEEFKWFYKFDKILYTNYSQISHVSMPRIKKPE
jgi:hypothetical protein